MFWAESIHWNLHDGIEGFDVNLQDINTNTASNVLDDWFQQRLIKINGATADALCTPSIHLKIRWAQIKNKKNSINPRHNLWVWVAKASYD